MAAAAEKAKKQLDGIKVIIRSLLLSSKEGVPCHKMYSEFLGMTGERLPYKEFGYSDCESFCGSLKDVVRVGRNKDGEEAFFGVADSSTQHIQDLVSKQRSSKKRQGRYRPPAKTPVKRPTCRNSWSSGPRRPAPDYSYSSSNRPSQRSYGMYNGRTGHSVVQETYVGRTGYSTSGVQGTSNGRTGYNGVHGTSNGRTDYGGVQGTSDGRTGYSGVEGTCNGKTGYSGEPVLSSSSYESTRSRGSQLLNNNNVYINDSYGKQKKQLPATASTSRYARNMINCINEVLSITPSRANRECKVVKQSQSGGITIKVDNRPNPSSNSMPANNWHAGEIPPRFRRLQLLGNRPNSPKLDHVKREDGYTGTKCEDEDWDADSHNRTRDVTNNYRSTTENINNFESNKEPDALQLPDSNEWPVIVCCINSAADVRIRFFGPEYSELLENLEDDMDVYFGKTYNQQSVGNPKQEHVYAILPPTIESKTQSWSRVRVKKVEGKDALVEFLDHGDIELVPISQLYQLPEKFKLQLAYQHISVKLTGLELFENPLVLEQLCSLALGKTCMAEVDDTVGKVSVTLYDTSGDSDININQLAARVILNKELLPRLPDGEKTVEGYVSHVGDEGKIHFQLIGPGLQRLEALSAVMLEVYSQSDASLFISTLEVGQMCVAKYSGDGLWYRAVVQQLLKSRKVKVLFIDYGNIEVISHSCLRDLHPSHPHMRTLPSQAIECRIHGISFNAETWTKEALQALTVLTLEKTFTLRVVEQAKPPDQLAQVELYLANEEDDLTLLSDLMQLQTSVIDEGKQPVNYGPKMPPSVIQRPTSGENIIVTWVADPHNFSFIQQCSVAELQTMMLNMADYYVDCIKTPDVLEVGELYAARNPKDGMWYRVRVKTVLSASKQILAHFVDFGAHIILKEDNVRVLPPQFLVLPTQSMKGKLAGLPMPEGGWSTKAIARFTELTTEQELTAWVLQEQMDDFVSLKLIRDQELVHKIMKDEFCEHV